VKARSIVVPVTLIAIFSLFVTPEAVAQDRSPADLVREEDEQRESHWVGFYRVRAGYPQTLSGGLSVIRARLPKTWECVTTCPFRGLVLQVEPGLHGAQVGAGFATLMAEKRQRKHRLADVHVAFGVKGVLLRTWSGANISPPDSTFAGIEFSYTVTGFNFSVGTLRRIDNEAGADWLVSGGFGWGF